MKVHFLNFLYDHKDYANFDNAFSIVMKNFPEPIRLETNSSLQDGNKSENSVLNLTKDAEKIAKKIFFPTALPILFNKCEDKRFQIPKMSLFKSGIRI